jgi:hypothetical protein
MNYTFAGETRVILNSGGERIKAQPRGLINVQTRSERREGDQRDSAVP